MREEDMLTAWASQIPAAFRPIGWKSSPVFYGLPLPPPGDTEGSAAAIRTAKQAAYAAQCKASDDLDARIIGLFADGYNLTQIGIEVRMSYEGARSRLKNCHPQRKSLSLK